MHSREKQFRHENQKPRKVHRSLPSFSSSLLDEICRSIDLDGVENSDARGENTSNTFREKSNARAEETARVSRVDKWMEMEAYDKIASKKVANIVFPENDLLSSSSASSSSDCSGALSSSDTEFFGCLMKPKVKPIRTGASPRENCDVFLFDDYQIYEKNRVEDDLIKSKSRAVKIYANLKKMKQPISPGANLTSLINSFFGKKSKDVGRNQTFQELKSRDRTALPSSASSFSRSCVNKDWQRSRVRSGLHFDPVVVDQDSAARGNKGICGKYGKPPLPPNAASRAQDQRKCGKIGHDEDEDDTVSESSSDLFELDPLSLFGKDDCRFRAELPVYETTCFDQNRGLIR